MHLDFFIRTSWLDDASMLRLSLVLSYGKVAPVVAGGLGDQAMAYLIAGLYLLYLPILLFARREPAEADATAG